MRSEDDERWRPGWAVAPTVLCLGVLGLLAASFLPELVRDLALMQDGGQDLANTLGVAGNLVGLGLALGSMVPGVWFLATGGRTLFCAAVALAGLWAAGVLALLGDDLPAVVRSLLS